MYSVGSVKRSLKKFFGCGKEHFICLVTDGVRAYLGEIKLQDGEKGKFPQVISLRCEHRRADDELFYEEILYRFCRDRNIASLPLCVCLAENLSECRDFEFPPMKRADIAKALKWELESCKADYLYCWHCEEEGSIYRVRVFLCRRSLIEQYRQASSETGLFLSRIAAFDCRAEEAAVEGGELAEKAADQGWFAKGVMSCLDDENEFSDREHPAAKWNWRRIYTTAAAVMAAISIGCISFWHMSYNSLQEQTAVLSQRNELLQGQRQLISELERDSALLEKYQSELKQLQAQSQPLYPFLAQAAAKTADGAMLTSVYLHEGVLEVRGRAADYAGLEKCRQSMQSMPFIASAQMKEASLNSANNMVDFALELSVKSGKSE